MCCVCFVCVCERERLRFSIDRERVCVYVCSYVRFDDKLYPVASRTDLASQLQKGIELINNYLIHVGGYDTSCVVKTWAFAISSYLILNLGGRRLNFVTVEDISQLS